MEGTQVIVVNNPFKHFDRDITIIDDIHGDSLLSFRNKYLPTDINFSLAVNGAVIKSEDWSNYQLQKGDSIVCVPKIEAFLALPVAAYILGTAATVAAVTATTIGLITYAFLYVAFTVIGGLLINTLMGALFGGDTGGAVGGSGSGLSTSQSYSWNPNTAQKAGMVIPRAYGTFIVHGNIISVHSDNVQNAEGGTDAYLNTLISLGYGPYSGLYEHKINDQPIADFTNVRLAQRLGLMKQSAIPYFDDTKTEYTLAVDINHSAVEAGYVYTTIGDSFNGLEVDLNFPSGIYYMDNYGNIHNFDIHIRVDYRKVGDVDWQCLTKSTTYSSSEHVKVDTEQRWGLGQLVWAAKGSYLAEQFIAQDLSARIDSAGRVLGRLEVDPDSICSSTGYTRADLTRYNLFSPEAYYVPATDNDCGQFPAMWIGTISSAGPSPYTGAVSGLAYNGCYTTEYTWEFTSKHISEESERILPENEYQKFTSNKRESMTFTLKTKNNLLAGHYEIRVTKCSADINNSYYGDKVKLTAVREVYSDNFSFPREVLVGLNALATGQLSGRFDWSCKVKGGLIRVYDGTNWKVKYNNNPAWVCYDIITQPVFNDADRVLVGGLTFICSYSNVSTINNKPGIGTAYLNPAANSDTYVKATTKYNTSYWPYFATDTSKSLIGSWEGNAWVSGNGENASQRFHIDLGLGNEKIIDTIYYENGHHLGVYYTKAGVRNFILQGSNSATAFANLDYGTDDDWTTIPTSEDHFDEHKASDAADPKYIFVYGNTAYRYYAFKFVDNYGFADFMGLRRVRLKGSTDRWSSYWTLTEPVSGTIAWELGKSYKDISDSGIARYEGYDPARVDYASFKTWADWCDTYVYKGSGPIVRGADGKKYGCIRAHTSSNATRPGTSYSIILPAWVLYWAEIAEGTATTWASGTAYTLSAERRMVFNGIFDTEYTLWDAASKVASSARASLIWNGSEVEAVIDKAATAVQLFSLGNIIADSFEETFLPLEDRVSEIEIVFVNEEKNYERDVCSIYNTSITGVTNKTTLTAVGVTSPSQAWRMGEYLLACNQYLKKSIKFDADVDAIACTIGDVINFQHDVPKWGLAGGRLVSATINTVTLDQEVTVVEGTVYTIMIRVASAVDSGKDYIVTKDIIASTSGAVSTFTVTSNFLVIPTAFDVFAFGEHDVQVKPFRVFSIEHKQEQIFTIRAIEYNANVYTVDTGEAVRPSITYTTRETLAAVTNLELTENNYFDPSGVFVNAVNVRFTKPSGYVYRKAIIKYRATSTDVSAPWIIAAEVEGESCTIEGLKGLTTYTVMVISVSQIGEQLSLSKCPSEEITTSRSYNINEFIMGNIGGLQIFGQGNLSTFDGRDCKFVWNPMAVSTPDASAGNEIDGAGSALPAIWFKDYEVKIYTSEGVLRRTEYVTDTFYIYTYEKNAEDSGGPKSSFKITVAGRDRLGRTSPIARGLTVTNTNPDNVGTVTPLSIVGGVSFSWPKNDDTDFGTYVYRKKVGTESYPTTWTDVADNKVVCTLTAAQVSAHGNKATISIQVKAKDVYGNISATASESSAAANYVSDSLFQLIASTTGAGDVTTLYDGVLTSGGITI